MNMKQVLVLSLSLALTAFVGCAGTDEYRSTGQVMDDTSIAARTKAALLANSDTDGLNIDVEVDRSKVQLNGFVDTQAQVNRAGEIARDIEGVTSVQNNLQVSDGGDRMAGEYIDDKTLLVKVKAALADDPVVHSLKIDVEVNRGEVSLGGYVGSAAERNTAVEVTRRVEGVVKVYNNLTVR